MHTINLDKKSIYTDLVYDAKNKLKTSKKKVYSKDIKSITLEDKENKYTTIFYKDITDRDNYKLVQASFIKELKKYLKPNIEDKILVVGLGNEKSTPDSLGPSTINNILVTSHLFLLGDVEEGYSNVCSFSPNVVGNTGIETSNLIKSIIKEVKATKVIVIDSLKTNDLKRVNKIIQITDFGISPGSGIGNKRSEISKKTMNIDVIAIGVPTVVGLENEFILTPTNIDFMIDKLSLLIGNGINNVLHKNFIRHNNYLK